MTPHTHAIAEAILSRAIAYFEACEAGDVLSAAEFAKALLGLLTASRAHGRLFIAEVDLGAMERGQPPPDGVLVAMPLEAYEQVVLPAILEPTARPDLPPLLARRAWPRCCLN